jgi:hypothetical protein
LRQTLAKLAQSHHLCAQGKRPRNQSLPIQQGDVGIPYQSWINLYLRDCAASHRKLNLNWK